MNITDLSQDREGGKNADAGKLQETRYPSISQGQLSDEPFCFLDVFLEKIELTEPVSTFQLSNRGKGLLVEPMAAFFGE